MKKEITLFWFKRDLRIEDNPALEIALSLGKPILLVYFFEPSLQKDAHYNLRHFQFIKESIVDLNYRFQPYNTSVLCVEEEVVPSLKKLINKYAISTLVSTQETGLGFTFKRDKEVAAFCKENNITWTEAQHNNVIRGLKDRTGWAKNFTDYISKPVVMPALATGSFIPEAELQILQAEFKIFSTETELHDFQKGGRTEGEQWMQSFFNDRIRFFTEGISKPLLSRKSCSRVSPYVAWGNISVRELCKQAVLVKNKQEVKKRLLFLLAGCVCKAILSKNLSHKPTWNL